MADKRRKTDEPHDPDRSDIEIDAANDEMGGPNTGSKSAGLTSSLHPSERKRSGGRGAMERG
jgi:hypothetical protein